MTTATQKMNISVNRVIPAVSVDRKNFFSAVASLFGSHPLAANKKVNPYDFNQPENQRTNLSFHRLMW